MIALAAGLTWLVVRLTPTKKPDPASPSALDSGEREDVIERRVLEAVRLGDRLVGELALEHVDAPGERPVARDGLGEAELGDLLDVRAASRSSARSSR